MNLATLLTRTSAQMPDRIALCLGEATLTYRELDDASDRVADPGSRPGPMHPAPTSSTTEGQAHHVDDDALKPAPTELGGPGFRTLADAPGTYVFDN